jgi:hypothetical protein
MRGGIARRAISEGHKKVTNEITQDRMKRT